MIKRTFWLGAAALIVAAGLAFGVPHLQHGTTPSDADSVLIAVAPSEPGDATAGDATAAPVGCVVAPSSLEAEYEKYNAKHAKDPVTKDCYADGKLRLFAINHGSSVNGLTRDERGWTKYSFTIWRHGIDTQRDRWELVISIAQPDILDTVVQVWVFDVVNGEPQNMQLKSVDYYRNLRVAKGILLAADGKTPQRVDQRHADDDRYDVSIYDGDGNLVQTGTVDRAGEELRSTARADATVHAEAVPPAWLEKPDLTGIPMPSDAH